jgi:hypothetical protein
MSLDNQTEDPFGKLIESFSVLENDNRALSLLSVYIGQRTDSNTIVGILEIYNKLKGEEVTPGKLRSYLTSFVNTGLIERETEKLMGTTKVGFHQITTLGMIGVLYLCFDVIDNPSEISWDSNSFKEHLNKDENSFIQYLTDNFVKELKSPAKIISMVTSGSNLNKLKINPQELNITLSLGKDNTFKVFEELLFNFLQVKPSLSKSAIENSLQGESVGKYFNKLGKLIIEEKIGKTSYYLLSTKGTMLLPIIAMFIRELSLDKSLIESVKSAIVNSDENPWMALVRKSILSFRKLFRIEELF